MNELWERGQDCGIVRPLLVMRAPHVLGCLSLRDLPLGRHEAVTSFALACVVNERNLPFDRKMGVRFRRTGNFNET